MTKPYYMEQQDCVKAWRKALLPKPGSVSHVIKQTIAEIKRQTMSQQELDTEIARVRDILDKIEYRRHDDQWSLYLGVDDSRLYLQVKSTGTLPKNLNDITDALALRKVSIPRFVNDIIQEYLKHFPDEGPWSGRKWLLSPHMVTSEIVRTAYLAYEAAERHEIQEAFRYRGAPVMGPHQHMDELADLMTSGVLHDDVRKNGMQGA